MRSGHLPQAEIAVSVGDAKLVALLVELHSGHLGKRACRPWRRYGQLVIPLPQADGTVLATGQIYRKRKDAHKSAKGKGVASQAYIVAKKDAKQVAALFRSCVV